MKRNILILFCVTSTVLGLTALTWNTPVGYEVLASSYTCEPSSRNPMHPCGPLRWGGNVHAPGLACPVAWRDRIMEVPGFGRLRCDDTPAQDYLYGLPHIDIRVSTVNQALQIGIQRMVIYSADSVQPAPTPTLTPPSPPLPTIFDDDVIGEGGARGEVVSTAEPVVQSQDLVVALEPVVAAPPAEHDASSQLYQQVNTIKSSIYTVIANDTLYDIALKHNTTVHQLRTLNQITGDLILIGQKITLSTDQQVQAVAEPAPTPPPEPAPAAEPAPAPEPPPAPESAVSQQIHTVQPGEWIYAIARRYAISPDLLLKANNLSNPNLVQPGLQLIIPNQ